MNNSTNEISEALAKILAELRRQNALKNRHFAISLIPLLGLIIFAYFSINRLQEKIHREKPPSTDWYQVAANVQAGNLTNALEISDKLLEETPSNFEGHYRKGEILLMLERPAEARASFERAKAIFPIYKFKSALEALDEVEGASVSN